MRAFGKNPYIFEIGTFTAFGSSPIKRKLNHHKTSSCQLEGSPEIDGWVDNSLNEYHKLGNLKTLSEKKLSRIQSPGTFLVQRVLETSLNNMNSSLSYNSFQVINFG